MTVFEADYYRTYDTISTELSGTLLESLMLDDYLVGLTYLSDFDGLSDFLIGDLANAYYTRANMNVPQKLTGPVAVSHPVTSAELLDYTSSVLSTSTPVDSPYSTNDSSANKDRSEIASFRYMNSDRYFAFTYGLEFSPPDDPTASDNWWHAIMQIQASVTLPASTSVPGQLNVWWDSIEGSWYFATSANGAAVPRYFDDVPYANLYLEPSHERYEVGIVLKQNGEEPTELSTTDNSEFRVRIEAFDAAGGSLGIYATDYLEDDFGVWNDVLELKHTNYIRLGSYRGSDVDGTSTTTFSNFTAYAESDADRGQWEVIQGSSGPDTLDPSTTVRRQQVGDYRTADRIEGLAGNDTIYGRYGPDELWGGEDNDLIYGGTDADILYGGDGTDDLSGDFGNDTIYGNSSSDNIYGGNGLDFLYGGDGSDTIRGNDQADFIDGGADADSIRGGSGTDTIFGGGGNDTIHGDANNDVINGLGGNDYLRGGSGGDVFHFGYGGGVDIIYDFDSSSDDLVVSISESNFGNGVSSTAYAYTVNAGSQTNVYIDLDGSGPGNDVLRIYDTTLGDVHDALFG
jgi:hypothetical protein